MKIVVGLGNPGARYEKTRHNVGFKVLDRLSIQEGIPFSFTRYRSICGEGRIDSSHILLAKPLTFMNRSGEAVRQILSGYGAQPADLVVVHDDIDMALGKIRLKKRGGDGGHQGVRSIIECLNRNDFLRVKVGIGRPPTGVDPAVYVLEEFDEDELQTVDDAVLRATKLLIMILAEGIESAMSRFQSYLPRTDTSKSLGS